MNKILRYSFVALLAMLGMTANAGVIVFGELGLENGVQYSDPFDGGDFTVTFGGGGNDGKYYNAGAGIRVYGGGTMTISAKSGTLTKIGITFDGSYKPETADVVDGGTYDPTTGIWTGNASTVVFTRPSGSGHWRVKKIATNGDVEDVTTPTEGQTPETAITVTRALELINALEDGASTDFSYYVKGVCTSVKSITTTNAQFYMGDDVNATATVQTYGLKGLGNKDIVNTNFVTTGDQVVVKGVLQKYKNNGTGEITPEVSSGYVYSVNGKTEDDTHNPEDDITNGTQDNPMTVAEALGYISKFSAGFITTKQYYVKGSVTAITEINTENGNATFNMGDLVCFRMKGLENKSITDENYIKQNDEVIVLAKLQSYKKDDTVTPELSSGYIYSLNGNTQEGGGGSTTEYSNVGSIERLIGSNLTENINLQLTNAKVVFNDGNSIYVREGNSALCFYKVEGTKEAFVNNAVINGTIAVNYTLYKDKMPQATNNTQSNVNGLSIVESEEEAVGHQTWIGGVDQFMCDLVQLGGKLGKQFKDDGTTIDYYYLYDDSGNTVVLVNNSKGLNKVDEGTELWITGVVNVNSSGVTQIKLTKNVDAAGIHAVTTDTLNGPAYNMAGQRVNMGYKGLIIKNGVKYINR